MLPVQRAKCCIDPFSTHEQTGAKPKTKLKQVGVENARFSAQMSDVKNLKPFDVMCPTCYTHFLERKRSLIQDQEEEAMETSFSQPMPDSQRSNWSDTPEGREAKGEKGKEDPEVARLRAQEQEYKEVLAKMKNLMTDLSPNSKHKLLRTLPWGEEKISKEMGVSRHTARKAKAEEAPRERKRRKDKIPSEVEQMVKTFLLREDVSRTLPGARNFVIVRRHGTKLYLTKHHLLSKLSQAFDQFKLENESVKLGFSKFCEFRPVNCILTYNSSGLHQVCSCVLCENPRLMILTSNIGECPEFHSLVSHCDGRLTELDIVNQITCDEESDTCFLGRCTSCEELAEEMADSMAQILEDLEICDLRFDQW